MNPLEMIKKIDGFIEQVNNILNKHGIREKISLEDLSFGDHTILARN